MKPRPLLLVPLLAFYLCQATADPSPQAGEASQAMDEVGVAQVPVETPQVESHDGPFGDHDDFADGWGSGGNGGIGSFFFLAPPLTKRCTAEDRLELLKAGGGTPPCETAAARAIDWLTSHQNEDGSWGTEHRGATTGLALLAYQGRCETVLSEKHGDAVLKAIMFLLNHAAKNQGSFTAAPDTAAGCFEQAIAVGAMAEASIFCRQFEVNVPNLHVAVQQAAQQIIRAAAPSGGWPLPGETKADPLLTAIQLQALKACKQTGLDFKGMTGCVRAALTSLDAWHAGAKGHPATLLTGAVGLAYSQWAQEDEKVPRLLRQQIARDFTFRWADAGADLPALYFNAHFLFTGGGDAWTKLNAMFLPELLAAQRPDGSFVPLGPDVENTISPLLRGDGPTATHLRTCLAALTLEVYYRYRRPEAPK
jgi:hypothetical protein